MPLELRPLGSGRVGNRAVMVCQNQERIDVAEEGKRCWIEGGDGVELEI